MRTIDDIVPSRTTQNDPICFTRQDSLDAYLAQTDYVSASMLRRTARAGVAGLDSKIDNDPSQRLAQALHALVLEPARFARAYFTLSADAVPPPVDALDRVWLSGAEYAALAAARDAIRAYSRAPIAQWLDAGMKELSIYWRDQNGRRWKARPDCFTRDIVLELKTTVDVRPRAFAQTRRRFGYDLKAAHYIDGVQRLTGSAPRFAYVAVELAPPHYVWLYELSAAELARAQKDLQSAKTHLSAVRSRTAAPASRGAAHLLRLV